MAREYLRSGALVFDVFTSIPVSYLEYFAIQACGMCMSDFGQVWLSAQSASREAAFCISLRTHLRVYSYSLESIYVKCAGLSHLLNGISNSPRWLWWSWDGVWLACTTENDPNHKARPSLQVAAHYSGREIRKCSFIKWTSFSRWQSVGFVYVDTLRTSVGIFSRADKKSCLLEAPHT